MGIDTKIQEYIDKVCSLIKNKDVHPDIKLELNDHIKTLKEDFMSSGTCEEEAVNKAISHMGDAQLVGTQLNKAHKAKLNFGILIPIISISLIGLFSMYLIQDSTSSSSERNIQIFNTSAAFYFVGFTLMVGLYLFDYRRLLSLSKLIYISTLIILILNLFLGTPVNGYRYLNIGFFKINFVNIAPLFLITSLAGIFNNWNWNETKNYILGLVLMAIPAFIIILSGFSAALIYAVGCLILMIASKAKLYQILIPVFGSLILPYLYILTEPYRLARLIAFIKPFSDPRGSGWIYIQLKNAINSAGFLGNSSDSMLKTIPEAHTDFIFTYITYTFGWFAAIFILMVILFFILRMINVAKVTKNTYGKLLVKGFIAILTAQFVLSILSNLGLSPLLGVSLPFMSYGGSQLIMDMTAVGLILSVYRRKDLSPTLVTDKVAQ